MPSTVPVQVCADKFLMSYRNCPHPSTGESPAKLLFGRTLRTRLDLLLPDVRRKVKEQQAAQQRHAGTSMREFSSGDSVLVRDYRNSPSKPTWLPATISERMGPVSYQVETPDGGLWNRHIEQIRSGESALTESHRSKMISESSYPVPAVETDHSTVQERKIDSATNQPEPEKTSVEVKKKRSWHRRPLPPPREPSTRVKSQIERFDVGEFRNKKGGL